MQVPDVARRHGADNFLLLSAKHRIRGNGHFHACGDAIRGVDRSVDVRPDGIRDRYGRKPDGINFL